MTSANAKAQNEKNAVVKKFRKHDADTGSPEVQIALLTKRIEELTKHFEGHVKDHSSRRGLLMMVSKRRSHLEYLKKSDVKRYTTILDQLNLRK